MIHRFVATVGGAGREERHEVTVERLAGDLYRVSVDGRERVLDAVRVEGTTWSLVPSGGGAARLVDVDGTAPDLTVSVAGIALGIKLIDAKKALGQRAAVREKIGPQPVLAPMPGKVVKVLVKLGEAVKVGQGMVVVEAMKMENELRAPRDGTVIALSACEGQAVEAGQALATVE